MYCDLNLIKIFVFFQQERNDATAQAGRAAIAAAAGGAGANQQGQRPPPGPNHIPGLAAIPPAPGQQQRQQGLLSCTIM
jgi:hypothetical protein